MHGLAHLVHFFILLTIRDSTRGNREYYKLSFADRFVGINFGYYTNRFGYGGDITHYPFRGGVSHSDDLIYLFPYPPDVAELNEEDTKVAKMLVDLWTSFATNGVPELSNSNDGITEVSWQPFLGKLSKKKIINSIIVCPLS